MNFVKIYWAVSLMTLALVLRTCRITTRAVLIHARASKLMMNSAHAILKADAAKLGWTV